MIVNSLYHWYVYRDETTLLQVDYKRWTAGAGFRVDKNILIIPIPSAGKVIASVFWGHARNSPLQHSILIRWKPLLANSMRHFCIGEWRPRIAENRSESHQKKGMVPKWQPPLMMHSHNIASKIDWTIWWFEILSHHQSYSINISSSDCHHLLPKQNFSNNRTKILLKRKR